MINHIYLHTSDLETRHYIASDPRFEPVPMYDSRIESKAHPNEFGRICSSNNYYHILTGHIRDKSCPWCDGPVEFRELSPKSETKTWSTHCIQCQKCGSRGPVITFAATGQSSEALIKEKEQIVWQSYTMKKMWDSEFKNPYKGLGDE